MTAKTKSAQFSYLYLVPDSCSGLLTPSHLEIHMFLVELEVYLAISEYSAKGHHFISILAFHVLI